MLIGSAALHLVLLLAFIIVLPERPPEQSPPADEVAMVFDAPSGERQPATQSATPSPSPSVAPGNSDAPIAPPQPDATTATAAPPPPPAPVPPSPAPPQPPAPRVTQAPPDTSPPVQEASVTPPVPVEPPPPTPTPARPETTVSLSQDEAPVFRAPPRFVPPIPPPPLPPLPPRQAPPRVTRPQQSNPFANPQNFSFNSGPQGQPGRASRGFDMSPPSAGSVNDSNLGYVSGAKPSGDWMGAIRRWVDARKYYPEGAIDSRQQGSVTINVLIDRSGKVLSVQLASSSRSPFLDEGFLSLFRGGTVPAFTPDMTDQTTTLRATMHFVLHIY